MDDRDFEELLRQELHREADGAPFRVDAMTVRERLDRRRRLPPWLLPVALPLGAAVLVSIVILNAFPGAGPGPGAGGTAGTLPSIDPASPPAASTVPTPAPTAHPAERSAAGNVSADGRLYLVGGSNRSGPMSSVVAFDGAVWSDLPNLPQARTGAAAAILPDGSLAVAGGRIDGEATDSMLILSPGAGAWSPGPPLPHAQTSMGSTVVDGRWYLFGGSVLEHAADVLVLAHGADSWTTAAPLPVALSRMAVAALDGVIYTFGGTSEPDGAELSTVMRYVPAADAWESRADLPGTGSWMSATVAEGRIWVLGAQAPDPGLGLSLIYDPLTDSWTEQTQQTPIAGRWHAALLQANGRILVLAGSPFFSVGTVDTRAP